MPHEPEQTFSAYVRERFESFGLTVNEEVYLPGPHRFADLHVTGDSLDRPMVVEIEDTFDGVIRSVGQVAMYALFLRARPIIMVPERHVQEPERMAIETVTGVRVIGIPFPEPESSA